MDSFFVFFHLCGNISRATQSKRVYQIIGTELSLSNLQQFIILIKWNDRENPKGSHKGKDRYDIYNIQIAMKFL